MNGTQLARKLKTSTRVVGGLIKSGTIKAERVKRAWEVDAESVKNFIRRNNAAVNNLKEQYVTLYLEGVTVDGLQRRAEKDFKQKGIIWPLVGFSEQIIYSYQMKNR